MTVPVAITGASGFIGRALVRRLLGAGLTVRALVRRPDSALRDAGAVTVPGSLEDPRSLERLVAGCHSVVHLAGTVRARRAADFRAVNAVGTERVLRASRSAGTRVLLVSSLAAREPGLSPYAASKRDAEVAVLGGEHPGADDAQVLRLPAVYGPGDRATRGLFRSLARGFAVIPALTEDARFSLLYVDDAAGAIEALLNDDEGWSRRTLEVDDGRQGGYAWDELLRVAGEHLGRRVRVVRVPLPLVRGAAALNELAAAALGRWAFLTRGKVAELSHPDWVAAGTPGALQGWRAADTFETGFPKTLEGDRDAV